MPKNSHFASFFVSLILNKEQWMWRYHKTKSREKLKFKNQMGQKRNVKSFRGCYMARFHGNVLFTIKMLIKSKESIKLRFTSGIESYVYWMPLKGQNTPVSTRRFNSSCQNIAQSPPFLKMSAFSRSVYL